MRSRTTGMRPRLICVHRQDARVGGGDVCVCVRAGVTRPSRYQNASFRWWLGMKVTKRIFTLDPVRRIGRLAKWAIVFGMCVGPEGLMIAQTLAGFVT
jgi:hypothetical protein